MKEIRSGNERNKTSIPKAKWKKSKLFLSLLMILTVSPVTANADATDDQMRNAFLKIDQKKIADRANSFRSQGFSYGTEDNLDDGYRKNIEMDCSIMSRKALWQISREDGGLTMSYKDFVKQVEGNSVGQNSWFSKNLPFSTSKLDTTYGKNDSRRFKGGSYYPSSQINTKRISDVGGSNRLEVADEAWPLFKKGDILLYKGHVSIVYEAGRHSTTDAQAETLGNGYAKLIHALTKDYPRGNPALTQTSTAKGGSFLGFVRLNEQSGDLEITKVTDAGSALAGVTFQLSKNANMSNPIGSKTTGANGIVSWPGIEPGIYYYRETAAPADYSFSNEIKSVTVNSGAKATVRVTNTKVNRDITINKTDAGSGQPLAGAVFGLYNSAGNEISRGTTNDLGKIIFNNIPKGVYTVKEISAPSGYNKSTQVSTTTKLDTVNKGGSEVFNFTNTRQFGEIAVQKFDTRDQNGDSGHSNTVNNGNGFVGTQFEFKLVAPFFPGDSHTSTATVFKQANREYLAVKTNLPLGRYEIREVLASEGYKVSEEKMYVDLRPGGTGVSWNATKNLWASENKGFSKGFSNETIKQLVNFTKVEKGTGRGLGNVEFTITRDDGKLMYNAITAANGLLLDKSTMAAITSLDYGNYTIEETKTREGYYISETDWKQNIFIQSGQTDYKLQMDNAPQSSVIKINKVDVETGKDARPGLSLAGAKYQVIYQSPTYKAIVDNDAQWKNLKAGDVVETITTNAEGFAQTTVRLPIGVYDIVEINPSTGYRKEIASTRIETLYDGSSVGARPQGKDKSTLFKVLADNRIPVSSQIDELNNWLNGYLGNKGANKPTIAPVVPHKLNSVADNVVYVSEAPELGRFEINKKYEQAGSSIVEVPELGAEFNVVDASGKIVDTMITNKDGFAASKYLPLGKYTLVQTKGPEGWYIAEDVSDGLDLHLETKVVDIVNKMVASRIKVVKTDASSGKQIPIKGVSFQLYENATGGKTLGFDVLYPEPGVIDTFETNEKGEVILPMLLGNGTYYLQEVKAPDGYYLNPNGERVKVVVKGENIIIEVQETEVEVPNIPQYAKLNIDKKGDLLTGWNTETVNFQGKDYEVAIPVTEEMFLAGAKFEITAREDVFSPDTVTKYYSAGDVVANIVTNADGTLTVKAGSYLWNEAKHINELLDADVVVEQVTMPIGKYNMVETESPDGYLIDKTVHEIDFDFQSQEIKFDSKSAAIWNEKLTAKFKFTKDFEDAEWHNWHEQAPEQTLFGLYNRNDIVVNGVTLPAGTLVGLSGLDENLSGSFEALFAGEYYIQELATHEAYELNDKEFGLEFVYDSEGPLETETEIENIENELKTTKIKVTKVDATSGERLPFAEYELYVVREDGLEELIGKFMTDENGYLELELEYGNYKLYEVKPPAGYVTDGSEVIEIPSDGGVDIEIEHENEKSRVEIAKKDKVTGEYLPGAHLSLIDMEAGKVVESWITTDVPHLIEGLVVGKEYKVIEIRTPDGYVTADDLIFTVKDSREVQVFTMFDDITRVEISKKDIDTGEFVVGSVLQIFVDGDEASGPIHEWTTEDRALLIEKLPVGKYILRELSAPGGYLIADDVKFEVLDTGDVQKVEMLDDYTKVIIKKVDGDTGRYLVGARLLLTDEKGLVIKEWTSTGEGMNFDYLPDGTYTLTELSAPNGYTLADPMTIVVDAHGDVQEFVLKNFRRTATLEIKKESGAGNNILLDGAVFKIEEFDEEKVATGKVEYYESGALNINYKPNSEVEFSKFNDFLVSQVITTNENGFASVSRLDDGIYYWRALDNLEVVHTVEVRKGMIFVSGLKHGFNYLITEIKAPDGYLIGDTPAEWFTPSIDETTKVIEYKRINQPDLVEFPPATGIQSGMAESVGLGAFAALGLAGLLLTPSKKKEEEESAE